MSDVDCMEILVDDEEDKGSKLDGSDDESIYECHFDIHEVIANTLANLDVKAQVQDAINTTRAQVDIIERKCVVTAQVFSSLDDQIKKLRALTTNDHHHMPHFKQLQRSPSQANQPLGQGRKLLQDSVTNAFSFLKKSGDTSMDVIPVARVVSKPPTLPPTGVLIRKDLAIGARVYAIKGSAYGVWYKARVVEIKQSPSGGELQYRVKYDSKKVVNQGVSGKQLAFHEPAEVLLPVGTRVIAQYRDEYWAQANSMYAGIVAEPPKVMNNYRYLIFFDDGYAQYVNHSETRVVCYSSREVWEDVHPDSKDFIKNYIKQYPERPMVKLHKGHIVKTEWNGKWWIARVMEVDASLVKMYFHADKRTEWIYRGSTRLEPLYSELANAEAVRLSGKTARRHNLMLAKKKSAPYVEYTRGLDEPIAKAKSESDDEWNSEKKQVARKHTSPTNKNVARKSTVQSPSKPSDPKTANVEGDGVVETRHYQPPFSRKRYVPHVCNCLCVADLNDDPVQHKGQNPLTIPILCGWERQVVRHKQVSKRVVLYRAPCGRRLRTMDEVTEYLSVTGSKLSVDLFCMDSYVHIFCEFVPSQVLCYIKDISYGKENVLVSGVNCISREYPEYVEYSTKRIPNKGVDLILDPEFLLCCDCDDNCSDRSRCPCQQLTIEATAASTGGERDDTAGYNFRRLKEPVVTGIYECNQKCKCSSQCLNRVVQNGLNLRLQVFKTEKRGWGIRCLDDIPQGGFICIYAGQLLTEQGANEDGTQFGDEYLAELDYIEVVERMKEGYESDVVESDSSESSDEPAAPESRSEKGQVVRSKQDAEKGDSDGSNWGDDKADANSSDSDFETSLGPVAPRVHSTRNQEKVQKLVLRRDPSDQESNHSWLDVSCRNVQQQRTKSTGSGSETSSVKSGQDQQQSSAPDGATSTAEDKATTDKSSTESNNLNSSKNSSESGGSGSPGSSTVTALQLKKLGRIPRLQKKQPLEINLESESEEDESGKASKSSSYDRATGKNEGERSSRIQSRFWSMPDPKKMEKTTQNKNNSGPGKKMKYKNFRSYFDDEFCYIMDAKSLGNIGRYLNHNCSPNVFVQNVFVDTHDLRFPWVAFFALQYIRAGSELTWDYNYDVGSVPDKVLYCYCGSLECRGRLL